MTAAQIREALDEPVAEIVLAVRQTLDAVPPEPAGDVMGQGIVPLDCVAVGSGKCVEQIGELRRTFATSVRP